MTAAQTRPDQRRLAHLLRAARSALGPDDVMELIVGVLAAPAEVGTDWHRLVADPAPPALAEALEELRAHMASGYHDGLAPEDFARLPRPARLQRLREALAAEGLDGFIVPRGDQHQGEYVPPCGQRLAWLTGFTGSAGLAIVRPLHPAGGAAGRHRTVRDPPSGRRAGLALARHRRAKGRRHRLRPVAAYAARGRAFPHRRRARRRQAPAGGQRNRPGLAGPAAGAARAGGAASRQLRRRERRSQAQPARPGAGRGRRRGRGVDDA